MKALIFDVDGTLAETEELHRRAFNASFAQAGLSWIWDRELYGRLLEVTGGKERIRYFMDAFGGTPTLPADRIASLHAEKTRHYTELVKAGALELRPGIKRLLDEARDAGLKLSIATTTTRANVDALLSATLGPDGTALFDAIAAGDAVAAKKPAPDIYKLALQQMNLSAVDCVAIEDTLNGVKSALGAGVPVIVTTSIYGGKGLFPGALTVIEHLDDSGDGMPVGLQTIERWLRAPEARLLQEAHRIEQADHPHP